MLKRLFPPPPEPELANEPLQKVDALGGPLGDIKHSSSDLARATALATGEHAAMFSHLDVRHSRCFGPRWTKMWAIVMNGTFRVYRNQASSAPHRIYEVKDCDCIIVDDMIDTAGTLCKAADVLIAKGAKRVFAFASHGLLSGPGNDRIANSKMEECVILNTIPSSPQRSPRKHEAPTHLKALPLHPGIVRIEGFFYDDGAYD